MLNVFGKSFFYFILFFSLSAHAGVFDTQPRIVEQHYQFTYDALTLPDNERMGLMGGNYLLDFSPSWFGGLGIYGAVTGDRGGFFVGGFDAGWRRVWRHSWATEVGAFAGGGGGGGAPQGGGLMLRPHVQLDYVWRDKRVFAGISRVWFPNGDILSDQVYGGFAWSFSTVILPGASDTRGSSSHGLPSERQWSTQARRFLVESMRYSSESDFHGRGGNSIGNRIDLIGVRWQSQLSSSIWGDFSTHGALGGMSDGYAQVFAGAVYREPIFSDWHVGAGAFLGAAGGGDVDTGGGLLTRSSLMFDWQGRNDWLFQLEAGWTHALDGRFDAATWVLSAGRAYNSVALGQNASSSLLATPLTWWDFGLRVSNQRYAIFQNGNGRKSATAPTLPIDMVGLKIDRFLGSVYVTGQAYGAYDGEAGGYAVGLLGGGWRAYRARHVYVDVEALGGAAGGGGVAVGSGLIAQPMVNCTFLLNPSFGITAASGYVASVNGDLRAWLWEFGVSYSFSVPYITNG